MLPVRQQVDQLPGHAFFKRVLPYRAILYRADRTRGGLTRVSMDKELHPVIHPFANQLLKRLYFIVYLL
jgi:hypothetical protein